MTVFIPDQGRHAKRRKNAHGGGTSDDPCPNFVQTPSRNCPSRLTVRVGGKPMSVFAKVLKPLRRTPFGSRFVYAKGGAKGSSPFFVRRGGRPDRPWRGSGVSPTRGVRGRVLRAAGFGGWRLSGHAAAQHGPGGVETEGKGHHRQRSRICPIDRNGRVDPDQSRTPRPAAAEGVNLARQLQL